MHKRDEVSVAKNYRPVQCLDNVELSFEDVLMPQLEKWLAKFLPEWQYGFLKKIGTLDYGAALSLTIQDCLERRKEGVLILSDIKGAFDRCWWLRLKNRLKKKGMRSRALMLIKRFLRVVDSGKTSSMKQIFSYVPQGGKFSPPLWDFDISEMADLLCDMVQLFGYADDVAL